MQTLNESTKQSIKAIWDKYIKTDKKVYDTKDNAYEDIDKSRLASIEDIKKIFKQFVENNINVYEFKTNLDSYNKRNNYWGFTAAKGQMFFNLVTKSSEKDIETFAQILQRLIKEPSNVDDACSKLKELFDYVSKCQALAIDKRKTAIPKSASYFLSYFWQIQNPTAWPIMYTSIIKTFEKLGIWKEQETAQDNYRQFFDLNELIKNYLQDYSRNPVSNWEIEHALWNFAGTTIVNSKPLKIREEKGLGMKSEIKALDPGFELRDYIIPRVYDLIELGISSDKTSSSKGSQFEKKVCEVFKQLDFEVKELGQGTGREPDAIIKFREEHVAFIVDAKAYSAGYTLGTGDRAIKEYINYYSPKLRQEGFTKLGFIIVSNSFRSDLSELVNSITWSTDVKRFIPLTTEALLYLLAYKTKERLTLSQIIEALISFTSTVTTENIIEKFGDY